MRFYADLHVHSKHSRATSSDLDLESLSFWAQKKGIAVVGTGDFTHPGWRAELEAKLVPAEPGLFRLRPELERSVAEKLGSAARGPVRFLLTVEISSIYKRTERTRKVHNLVYVPSLDLARAFSTRLERIGNLASDGRPILGLDSRDLLEIVLETGGESFLVPAHIWTPWFSALGSKSGFDSIDECFADLAAHVFAVETGLSSDPAMNWRLSTLDRFRLMSSSDAHSAQKLGREACVFETELDYFAMRRALETGDGYGGTIEFFPEEGKYHLDGHRACGIRFSPEESRREDGNCPVCRKPLTLGVLSRVEALADRPEGHVPEGRDPYRCLVPLPEVLAELSGVSATSGRVKAAYEAVITAHGPELFVLEEAPLEDLERSGRGLLAEALRRMRAGRVITEGGYDGEYGVIRMFEPKELQQTSAFGWAPAARPVAAPSAQADTVLPLLAAAPSPVSEVIAAPEGEQITARKPGRTGVLAGLDPDQAEAASIVDGPLLIVAGPGTGKTRTLTHRLAHLVLEEGVTPSACLAITFTRRAAAELEERLEGLLGTQAKDVRVATFHALGASILRDHGDAIGLDPGFGVASSWEQAAVAAEALGLSDREVSRALEAVSRAKRETSASPDDLQRMRTAYDAALRARNLVDQDDLVALAVALLEQRPETAAAYRARWRYLSIDEYQDIDALQYRLVRQLVSAEANVCVIGDPDQAIYAFRGGDVRFFTAFAADYPGARTVELGRSYRTTPVILEASSKMIAPASLVPNRRLVATAKEGAPIDVVEAATERAEAELVVHRIEAALGGYSFHSVDTGRVETGDRTELGFADVAILYRSGEQLEALEEALERSGIPYQRRSHGALTDTPAAKVLLQALAKRPREGRVADGLAAVAEGREVGEVLEVLRPIAERAGEDFSRFFLELATSSEVDTWDARADRVSLLTLHASKGLEFPLVFIVGCEAGILPHRFSADVPGGEAEERRLFYVGMTRAKRHLVLTRAKSRMVHGRLDERSPSPFLGAIPERCQRVEGPRAPKKKRSAQLSLF